MQDPQNPPAQDVTSQLLLTLGKHEGRLEGLENYEKTQNGALIRLGDRVENINNDLGHRINEVENKLYTKIDGLEAKVDAKFSEHRKQNTKILWALCTTLLALVSGLIIQLVILRKDSPKPPAPSYAVEKGF